MKYNPFETKKFRKDFARCTKRGYDMELLFQVTDDLASGVPLAKSVHNPHYLKGKNPKVIECHITSPTDDWLLEYRYDGDDIIFMRTGTHADLFD